MPNSVATAKFVVVSGATLRVVGSEMTHAGQVIRVQNRPGAAPVTLPVSLFVFDGRDWVYKKDEEEE